jgi:hypothetical protein
MTRARLFEPHFIDVLLFTPNRAERAQAEWRTPPPKACAGPRGRLSPELNLIGRAFTKSRRRRQIASEQSPGQIGFPNIIRGAMAGGNCEDLDMRFAWVWRSRFRDVARIERETAAENSACGLGHCRALCEGNFNSVSNKSNAPNAGLIQRLSRKQRGRRNSKG